MEDKLNCPRLSPRECGGWLAVSDATDLLQIGVTAASEQEARERFQEVRDHWQAIFE